VLCSEFLDFDGGLGILCEIGCFHFDDEGEYVSGVEYLCGY
jgi:hypothetical protein